MGKKKSAKRGSNSDRHVEDAENNDNKSTETEMSGKRKPRPQTNAARERSRVQNLKSAFLDLQKVLPNVPQGTKLSKLDVLLLATNYISHLMSKLSDNHIDDHVSRLKSQDVLHPIKKWPMRRRLYLSDPISSQADASANGHHLREDSLSDNTSEKSSATDDISDASTPNEVFDRETGCHYRRRFSYSLDDGAISTDGAVLSWQHDGSNAVQLSGRDCFVARQRNPATYGDDFCTTTSSPTYLDSFVMEYDKLE